MNFYRLNKKSPKIIITLSVILFIFICLTVMFFPKIRQCFTYYKVFVSHTTRIKNEEGRICEAFALNTLSHKPKRIVFPLNGSGDTLSIGYARLVLDPNEIIKISYHRITEDYTVTSIKDQPESDHRFISLERLRHYLSDSVLVPLAPFESLDDQKRYTLEIKMTGIALTAINLLSEDGKKDNDQTPLKSLFKEFLELTGYGRKEFSVKSRPFSLDEIYPGP